MTLFTRRNAIRSTFASAAAFPFAEPTLAEFAASQALPEPHHTPRAKQVLMVFCTVAAGWFIANAMQGTGTGTGTAPKSSDLMVKTVFLIGLGLYLDVVAMRSIGLYYHHFKGRFAWDWG